MTAAQLPRDAVEAAGLLRALRRKIAKAEAEIAECERSGYDLGARIARENLQEARALRAEIEPHAARLIAVQKAGRKEAAATIPYTVGQSREFLYPWIWRHDLTGEVRGSFRTKRAATDDAIRHAASAAAREAARR